MVGQYTVEVSAQDTAGRNKLLPLCPSGTLSELPHEGYMTASPSITGRTEQHQPSLADLLDTH